MFVLKTQDYEYLTIESNPNRFPDHTLALGTLRKDIKEILWIYDNDSELFTLQCLRNHTLEKDVKLVMPYIPHARMDRVEDSEVFTLQTFCKIINSLDFSEVIVTDPHSNVSIALLDRVSVIKPVRYIHETMIKIAEKKKIHMNELVDTLVFFFPDEGAMKRYSKMVPELPFAYGVKDRDWKTGKINGLNIINADFVKGKTVLIVDDICSRGGTFYHSSKALFKAGAKDVFLYVTHCEDSIFEGQMYSEGIIKNIFTTDSKLNKRSDNIDIVYSFIEEFRNGKIF